MNPRIKFLKAAFLGIPLVFLAASASAVVIDFTTGEGYSNGVLNAQADAWSTSSPTSNFQVNTAGGGSVSMSTTANSAIAGYFSPVSFTSGTSFTTSIDFQFNQSTASGSATSAFGMTYATSQTAGAANAAGAFLGRQAGTDAYRLISLGGTTNIAGSALGINSAGSDTLSDTIRMTLTLSYSSATTNWSGVATLVNLTTGITVATLPRNNVTVALSPTSLYGAIQNGSQMTTSGLSSVSILNYSTPTPVPESGTVVLAGLGLGAVLLFRRRMIQASR